MEGGEGEEEGKEGEGGETWRLWEGWRLRELGEQDATGSLCLTEMLTEMLWWFGLESAGWLQALADIYAMIVQGGGWAL